MGMGMKFHGNGVGMGLQPMGTGWGWGNFCGGGVGMGLMSTAVSLFNRKVRENFGNDSRYNRCNVYHNTMLTKALPTGW